MLAVRNTQKKNKIWVSAAKFPQTHHVIIKEIHKEFLMDLSVFLQRNAKIPLLLKKTRKTSPLHLAESAVGTKRSAEDLQSPCEVVEVANVPTMKWKTETTIRWKVFVWNFQICPSKKIRQTNAFKNSLSCFETRLIYTVWGSKCQTFLKIPPHTGRSWPAQLHVNYLEVKLVTPLVRCILSDIRKTPSSSKWMDEEWHVFLRPPRKKNWSKKS